MPKKAQQPQQKSLQEMLGCCPCHVCVNDADEYPLHGKCKRKCYNVVHESDDDFSFNYTDNCRTRCLAGRGECKQLKPATRGAVMEALKPQAESDNSTPKQVKVLTTEGK